jgi:hypothetical protein
MITMVDSLRRHDGEIFNMIRCSSSYCTLPSHRKDQVHSVVTSSETRSGEVALTRVFLQFLPFLPAKNHSSVVPFSCKPVSTP